MNDIKKDNRKALPRFLLIILASGLLGGVLGFGSAFAADTGAAEAVRSALPALLSTLAPWGIPVCSAAMLLPGWCLYRKAKALSEGWDGEDEAVMDTIDEKLNWSLFWGNLLMILDFFFLSFTAVYPTFPWMLVTVGLYFLSIALITFLQQKTVDLTRKLNPEKQGSIYDMNFKKKWLQSCDEAEQRQIGQAALKSYSVVNIACPVLWCALLILGIFFDTGLLPSAIVLLIWGISTTSYLLESIKLGKRN